MHVKKSTNASRSNSPTPTLAVVGDGLNVRPVTAVVGCSMDRCRECHGLKYESQYETGWQRAERQADQIWRRLGGTECDDDSFPPKPKGMHWITYERLSQRYETLTSDFVKGFDAWLGEWAAKTEHRRVQAQG